MITRRRFAASAIGAAGAIVLPGASAGIAQGEGPAGKIAFIEHGDVWQWSSAGETGRIVEDGYALDPTWDARGFNLLYARDGGSFSDLILVNTRTGSRSRLTANEGTGEAGSPDYVASSVWSFDSCWSPAGIVCYISDAGSEYGEMRLWILNPENGTTYPAVDDGNDQGPPEDVSVDASATYCVYTVFAAGGAEGGVTYISMRDINVGTTYPIIEAPQGAYAAAISPDGEHIVASLRDENGMSDLWLFQRRSERLTRLTQGENVVSSTWSPDGSWVAYLRRSGTWFELWSMPLDAQTGASRGDAQLLVEDREIDATSGISWTVI